MGSKGKLFILFVALISAIPFHATAQSPDPADAQDTVNETYTRVLQGLLGNPILLSYRGKEFDPAPFKFIHAIDTPKGLRVILEHEGYRFRCRLRRQNSNNPSRLNHSFVDGTSYQRIVFRKLWAIYCLGTPFYIGTIHKFGEPQPLNLDLKKGDRGYVNPENFKNYPEKYFHRYIIRGFPDKIRLPDEVDDMDTPVHE